MVRTRIYRQSSGNRHYLYLPLPLFVDSNSPFKDAEFPIDVEVVACEGGLFVHRPIAKKKQSVYCTPGKILLEKIERLESEFNRSKR